MKGSALQTQDRAERKRKEKDQEERQKGERTENKESQEEENGQKWCILWDISPPWNRQEVGGTTSEDICLRPQKC